MPLRAQTYPRRVVVNVRQRDLDECVRGQPRTAVDVAEVVRRHEQAVERAPLEVEPAPSADDARVGVQTERVAVLSQRPADERVAHLTVESGVLVDGRHLHDWMAGRRVLGDQGRARRSVDPTSTVTSPRSTVYAPGKETWIWGAAYETQLAGNCTAERRHVEKCDLGDQGRVGQSVERRGVVVRIEDDQLDQQRPRATHRLPEVDGNHAEAETTDRLAIQSFR